MTSESIRALLAGGEGISVEFKTCARELSREVYETVCAFLNRHGGTLWLGVTDRGEVAGLEPDAVARIKKDFVNTINNPQKLNPPAYLSIEEVAVDGRILLRIYVPEGSQVSRCNGRIYDRNEDGDLDITDHTAQVAMLYQRKQATYTENRVFPHLGLEDVDRELIARCRKIATLRREDHPWGGLDDFELLKSSQLYQTDPASGKSGLTLAGILLLGKPLPLLQTVSHHRTDLIVRRVNLDRYDDRDLVEVNLVESYDRIMAFVRKHLPDPFHLEGTTSISLRDAIFREVASNILIHREYTNAFPAKLIIERDRVRTENSNRPHGFGRLDPETFSPFPKNPVMARFFRQIGRADELGSGMRNLMKYGRAYGGADPELTEGDVFRITIRVPVTPDVTRDVTPEVGSNGKRRLKSQLKSQLESQPESLRYRILRSLTDQALGKERLANRLGQKQPSGQLHLAVRELVDEGLIERTIPEKPRSRLQAYRLTEHGRKLLEGGAN